MFVCLCFVPIKPPAGEESIQDDDSSSSGEYQEVVSDAILFQEAQRMAEMREEAKKLVDTPSDEHYGPPKYMNRQPVQATGGREVVTVGDDR